ncbi:MAG: hypothetical protein IJ274_16275 [Lachnospiraceae bacterium]|nr:hypothetical protein [Lachnospiraceae bacterium]
MKRRRTEDVIAAIMLIAIICFGMFEMVVESGQITLTLLWILFCLAGENSFVLKKKQNKLI